MSEKKHGSRWRAEGVECRGKYLHIRRQVEEVKNGKKVKRQKWETTKLLDTPENVQKCIQKRQLLIDDPDNYEIDGEIVVDDFLMLFLNQKVEHVRDKTYSAYRDRAKIFSDYLGKCKVRDLKTADLQDVFDRLITERSYSPRTVKDIKAFIMMVFSFAEERKVIFENPAQQVYIKKRLSEQYATDKVDDDLFFTYEEAERFLECANEHELYELFYFTIVFGLRREEILGVRWRSIDLKRRILKIEHTITRGTKINKVNTTKTSAGLRLFNLDDTEVSLLEEMKQREEENRKRMRLMGKTYYEGDAEYVFNKRADGKLHDVSFPTKEFKKLLWSIPNMPREMCFRHLRNSCISIYVHEGWNIKSIQTFAGHADPNVTLRIYAKVKALEENKEMSKSLSRRLGKTRRSDNK